MKHIYLKRKFYIPALFLIAFGSISGCSKQQQPPKNNSNNNDDSGSITKATTLGDFTPTSGVGGTVIKISGKNFNTVPGNNSVFINGDRLNLYSVTSTEIIAAIPATANTGILTMTSGSTPLASTAKFTIMYGDVNNLYKIHGFQGQHVQVDRSNNIWGHDEHGVYKLNSDGTAVRYTGSFDDYKRITDFTIRPSGDIYIANADNFNIIKVTPQKIATVFAGSGDEGFAEGAGTAAKFSAIGGISHDEAGNLYVIDGHRVRKITSSGMVSTLAGSDADGNADGLGVAAQFGDLAGIAVDEWEGVVYVSDKKYHNIRKITPDGAVTTIAGNGTAGFVDGTGNGAQFYQPGAMAVDPSGNIWIADNNAAGPVYEIRVMNKVGLVRTYIKGTINSGDPVSGSAPFASVINPQGLAFDLAGSLYIDNAGPNVISKMTFKNN
ncbi:IPT/TIG domain-containing protein [Mucilaginibacter panaciglaebae]|uniref:IPT/TIG domain-containing protein n=1 Tax=Mucilaginibacter panaciglaebae TaxID=502331 RepID=A0ABP7WUR3_9SPHI